MIILAFALSTAVHAQKTETPKNPKAVYAGIHLSPDYSFRTLKNTSDAAVNDLIIGMRNDIEIARFGYTTGVNLLFHCSKNVGLETGIQYSTKGYSSKYREIIFQIPEPGLPEKFKSTYSYQYVGIPLKARFVFGDNKIRLLSSVGIITNWLLQVKQSTVLAYADGRMESSKQSSKEDFNRLDLSPIVSVGIDYRFSDKLYLSVEPAFRYGLLKTAKSTIAEHLWSAGVQFGIYQKLR